MNRSLVTVGAAVPVDFPRLDILAVPARIDSGARISAIWATSITEKNGELSFVLFAAGSQHHTGTPVTTREYETRVVTSSNGAAEERYVVRLAVRLMGRTIHARFSLANRSTQAYPVLIGRNVLRGKFLVDVSHGRRALSTVSGKESA